MPTIVSCEAHLVARVNFNPLKQNPASGISHFVLTQCMPRSGGNFHSYRLAKITDRSRVMIGCLAVFGAIFRHYRLHLNHARSKALTGDFCDKVIDIIIDI